LHEKTLDKGPATPGAVNKGTSADLAQETHRVKMTIENE
jgi:hypothetical protein